MGFGCASGRFGASLHPATTRVRGPGHPSHEEGAVMRKAAGNHPALVLVLGQLRQFGGRHLGSEAPTEAEAARA